MPSDITRTISQRVKLRTHSIVIRNDGPEIARKSVLFGHSAVPSSADGAIIGAPLAILEEEVALADLLSDPRAQQAMALIEQIAIDRLQAAESTIMSRIQSP